MSVQLEKYKPRFRVSDDFSGGKFSFSVRTGGYLWENNLTKMDILQLQ
jgi:hypothetical protein